MPKRLLAGVIAVTGALSWCSTPAVAHVAPAVDENNRYLRVAPMADRVRVAYIVYIGEVPGARARQRMDADRDGALSEPEADRYGAEIARAVAEGLELTIDGVAHPMAWETVSVGLGMPVVQAGSFSIDLIGWVCVPDPSAERHSLELWDRFRIDAPGESELKVQASPGVTVVKSTFGPDGRHSQLEMKWRGAGGPTAKLGYFLDFEVDADTRAQAAKQARGKGADDPCSGRPTPAGFVSESRTRGKGWLWPLAAALLGLVGGGWWAIRRRASKPGAARPAPVEPDAASDAQADTEPAAQNTNG